MPPRTSTGCVVAWLRAPSPVVVERYLAVLKQALRGRAIGAFVPAVSPASVAPDPGGMSLLCCNDAQNAYGTSSCSAAAIGSLRYMSAASATRETPSRIRGHVDYSPPSRRRSAPSTRPRISTKRRRGAQRGLRSMLPRISMSNRNAS